MISAYETFPNLSWWRMLAKSQSAHITFDIQEHFEKMSFRNRYEIAGPVGRQLLSVPLQNGRNQRKAIGDIRIANQDKWQIQHWRSIETAYRNSPFFEHYAATLIGLYTQPYERLVDFNKDSIVWAIQQLKWKIDFSESKVYIPANINPATDSRNAACRIWDAYLPPYFQVFNDKYPFIENLSILDLLFCEGPKVGWYLKMER